MPKTATTPGSSLSDTLKKLQEITTWFESQSEVDVEEGIAKVKEAAALIKSGKSRLTKLQNQFEEAKRGVGEGNE